MTEVRQARKLQPAGLGAVELRRDLIEDAGVILSRCTLILQDEHRGVRFMQHIFYLEGFVARIDGYYDRADPCNAKIYRRPFRIARKPHRNLVALLHAQGEKTSGDKA